MRIPISQGAFTWTRAGAPDIEGIEIVYGYPHVYIKGIGAKGHIFEKSGFSWLSEADARALAAALIEAADHLAHCGEEPPPPLEIVD